MGGKDEGGRLQHQGVEGRPDLDGLVAGRESPHRTDPIDTSPQPLLKPRAEFRPSPAHIPDVIVGGIVQASLAQPGIGLVQDGLGSDLVHPVHRCSPLRASPRPSIMPRHTA